MDLGPLVPVVAILTGLGWGWIGYKNRELAMRAGAAKEDAAQESSEKRRLESRVAVLEKIITDGGLQTAAQIEALRDTERTSDGDRVNNGEKVR
ncbi:hypothetical protein ACUXST_000579 [Sphingomonas sp. F9_3S_D5_B_2]